MTMTVLEFENAVWELEKVRIFIRAPSHEEVEGYNYKRKTSKNTPVTGWIHKRLHPCLRNYQVSIVDGNFEVPHGKTQMRNLRDTYNVVSGHE